MYLQSMFLAKIRKISKFVPHKIVILPAIKTLSILHRHVIVMRMVPKICIMQTCPCNVYPLTPHFYIVKLGFTGVYIIFLFLLQNIDCGYSLEPPQRGGSNVYP